MSASIRSCRMNSQNTEPDKKMSSVVFHDSSNTDWAGPAGSDTWTGGERRSGTRAAELIGFCFYFFAVGTTLVLRR